MEYFKEILDTRAHWHYKSITTVTIIITIVNTINQLVLSARPPITRSASVFTEIDIYRPPTKLSPWYQQQHKAHHEFDHHTRADAD